MIVPGLISVTFRDRPAHEIAALAAANGLRAIEWGGDVHVPPGDDAAADAASRAAADHGLTITGYGSYHVAGDAPAGAFEPVLATALRLGAPTIRVWAGSKASADAGGAYRCAVADGVRSAVELASPYGVTVALEFHGGTLTDTSVAALALCEETGARSHWQPPVGLADDDALTGLDALIAHLEAVHVFSWSPTGDRQALAARRELWRAALARLAAQPRNHPALLEFVADDDPGSLRSDAATLLELVAEVVS